MTKEQEAQQAQTIAGIRADVEHRSRLVKGAISMERRWRAADAQLKNLLKIVDSQAQKIAELRRENVYLKRQHDSLNSLMKDGAKAFEHTIAQKDAKIAEQAKELKLLDACMFQNMDSATFNHCQEYLEKMRGKNEKVN